MPFNLANKPGQWLLIRDPYASGGADVISASSEYNPRVGVTVNDEDNQGALLPAVIGAPAPDDDTAETVQFRIVRGGGIGSAEFAYKAEDAEWKGYNSEFFMWGHHAPSIAAVQTILLYSRVYRRLMTIQVNTTTDTIIVRKLDANDRPGSWTADPTTITPEAPVSELGHAVAACEIRDGSLLLGVRRLAIGTADNVTEQGDWDLYRSTDGGETWALVLERVHQTFASSSIDLMNLAISRMASSGDWVRWCFVKDDGAIATLASSDGGMTWEALEDLPVDDGVDGSQMLASPVPESNKLWDRQPFNIIGIDDATGTFLLAAQGGVNVEFPDEYGRAACWVSSRLDGWSFLTSIPTDVDETWDVSEAFVFIRDPYWLTLWVFGRTGAYGGDPSDAGWNVYRVPREEALLPASWIRYDTILPPQGVTRIVPMLATGVWAGDRAAMIWHLLNARATAQDILTSYPVVCYVGGWSGRPNGCRTASGSRAELIHWAYPYGLPAGGGLTGSTWSEFTTTLTAGGTYSHTFKAMRAESSAATDEATVGWSTGIPEMTWDCEIVEEQEWTEEMQSAHEWTMAVGNTAQGSNFRSAVKIAMPSSVLASGFGWRIAIRHGASSIIVVDDIGGTVLATLSGLNLATGEDDGDRHRVRLHVAPAATDGVPAGMLLYRNDTGDEWKSAGPFNLPAPSNSGITQYRASWGEFPGAAGGFNASWWYEFHQFAQKYRINYANFTSPDDLIGARTAIRGRALGAGATGVDAARLQVVWGGGGAAEGDAFTHELDHEGAAELALMDSPRLRWQSAAGLTGAYLILDAVAPASAGATDTGQRFVHSHCALFGMESEEALIDYADDSAFSTGVVAGGTLSAVAFTGLRVSAVNGNHLVLDVATVGQTIRRGDLTGKFLTVTAGVGIGRIHKVERHIFDGSAHHVICTEGGQFTPSTVSAGATVSVSGDRGWLAYGQTISKRYMRIRFGESGEENWSGRWALGGIVPGIAMEMGRVVAGDSYPAPVFDWSHSDEEVPRVTDYRSRSGVTWSRKEGPADRTITGRLVGDVTGFRYELRDLIGQMAGYRVQPMALLLNDEVLAGEDESLHLVRFEGPTSMDNQGYTRPYEGGPIRRLGDLQVVFRVIT